MFVENHNAGNTTEKKTGENTFCICSIFGWVLQIKISTDGETRDCDLMHASCADIKNRF